jgi:hypothetical protein
MGAMAFEGRKSNKPNKPQRGRLGRAWDAMMDPTKGNLVSRTVGGVFSSPKEDQDDQEDNMFYRVKDVLFPPVPLPTPPPSRLGRIGSGIKSGFSSVASGIGNAGKSTLGFFMGRNPKQNPAPKPQSTWDKFRNKMSELGTAVVGKKKIERLKARFEEERRKQARRVLNETRLFNETQPLNGTQPPNETLGLD